MITDFSLSDVLSSFYISDYKKEIMRAFIALPVTRGHPTTICAVNPSVLNPKFFYMSHQSKSPKVRKKMLDNNDPALWYFPQLSGLPSNLQASLLPQPTST